ncbi:chemotaxis protein CheW [Geobacter sp. DSM 9736]|uniref:chemotaxis protein CheW n=1 Tax=Geobacter sp. DSM 9736 TaxID=1277350 RepID=UPI000B513468|nr:chemotaxis protein CheW [Geobacter sp. DSM 9736]SNB45092.1 purine-binding chemotaxis protein CheW [Geobacter sp. DSM 9736]
MSVEIEEIQIACFKLGEDLFGIDIMRIREIIRPQRLSSLPKAPSFVEGVINLRGTIIPVIDLHKRFDMPGLQESPHIRLLIVSLGRQLIGLVVDDVTEVIAVPVKDIKPPPQVVGGIGAEYLIGVCLAHDNLIMLLNIDQLLTAKEAGELTGIQGERPGASQ